MPGGVAGAQLNLAAPYADFSAPDGLVFAFSGSSNLTLLVGSNRNHYTLIIIP
jgi:hypothetical protein